MNTKPTVGQFRLLLGNVLVSLAYRANPALEEDYHNRVFNFVFADGTINAIESDLDAYEKLPMTASEMKSSRKSVFGDTMIPTSILRRKIEVYKSKRKER